MLNGKQKRYLRSEANRMQAIFQIGKDGVHQTQIEGIMDALDAKELIKVKILETCSESKDRIALELSMKTKADVVQIMGRTIVLYKPSDKKLYKLP